MPPWSTEGQLQVRLDGAGKEEAAIVMRPEMDDPGAQWEGECPGTGEAVLRAP